MRKYALILAIIIVALTLALVPRTYSADLQAMIDATPAGGTLALPDFSNYTGNFVISKSINLVGSNGPAKATIVSPNADPAIQILPGTRDVRIDGLRVTTSPAWPTVHDIVRIGDQGPSQDTIEEAPANITLNNLEIFGQPTQEVQRGVSANGAHVTITNCRITEIHARGYDTQAIGVWNGPGPFTITDNYLEGSGENVMFGGAWPSIKVDGSTVPNLTITGVVFRRNHVVKPLSWRGVWSIKNLFEFKNCRNCVVDGNVFDGNWTDAQAGRAIVFTPRPSDSGPGAVVEDVTFSNNIVQNVGSGMLISGRDDLSSGFLDTRTKGIRVTNNVFEVDGPRFGSNGVFLTIINGTEGVTVENNTAIQTGNIITTDYAPSTGFTYRNNITRHNQYGIMGSGASPGNGTIAAYFPGSLIAGNVIAKEVDAPWNADLIYPSGNFFPANLSAVGFVDLAGGNYRLASWSPYKGAGTNGLDPGCDIDALNAAQNGGDPGPTPTPTPVPSPSPSPSASPTPSADGTKGSTITDNEGGVWTLGPHQETLRNSVHMSAGYGSVYKWLNSRVYVRGQDSNWYQWGASGWSNVGATEPGATPTPTPTPTVTPSPSPSPSPTPTPSPSPTPSPTPVPCLPTSWPTSIEGQNARMDERRAQGCYPVRRTKGGMEYARP